MTRVDRSRGPHPLPAFLDAVTRACAGDPPRLRAALAGLRRYQAAPPAMPRPERAIVARSGPVSLRDYADNAPHRRPATPAGPIVVFVPSLINAPTVLDLAPGNSLLDGMVAAGIRPLLVDWGDVEPIGLETLVETRLVPLIEAIGAPVSIAGYCLGGTLAIGAAALLGRRVERLALLATPWHFSGYGDVRGGLADWWQQAAPLANTLGVVPMELLQPAFWSIDPDGLAAKYARFSALPDGPEADAFTILEDWSNTGPPLSIQAAQGLAETLFRDDAPGRGEWIIAGRRIDPARLDIPILDVIAGRDRIVPPAAALTRNGPGTPLLLDAGHVGMVVGGRAPDLLWRPLARWLGGATTA